MPNVEKKGSAILTVSLVRRETCASSPHLRGREHRETASVEHRHSTTHSYPSAEHLREERWRITFINQPWHILTPFQGQASTQLLWHNMLSYYKQWGWPGEELEHSELVWVRKGSLLSGESMDMRLGSYWLSAYCRMSSSCSAAASGGGGLRMAT